MFLIKNTENMGVKRLHFTKNGRTAGLFVSGSGIFRPSADAAALYPVKDAFPHTDVFRGKIGRAHV